MDYRHHARVTVHGRKLLCKALKERRQGSCQAGAEP